MASILSSNVQFPELRSNSVSKRVGKCAANKHTPWCSYPPLPPLALKQIRLLSHTHTHIHIEVPDCATEPWGCLSPTWWGREPKAKGKRKEALNIYHRNFSPPLCLKTDKTPSPSLANTEAPDLHYGALEDTSHPWKAAGKGKEPSPTHTASISLSSPVQELLQSPWIGRDRGCTSMYREVILAITSSPVCTHKASKPAFSLSPPLTHPAE